MDKQKQVEEIEITQKAIRKSADGEGAFVDLLNQEMKELQESQKQIEEMASYLIGKNVTGSDSTRVLSLGYLTVREIASILVNAGYRKIPEGSVVLETSVYESLEIKNYRDVISERVRKETAEKFAERLKKQFEHCCGDVYSACQIDEKIDEIAKEITEGV